jgi:2-methylcitrate dehydratase PrpD
MACLVNGTLGYYCDIEPHHVAAVLHPAAVCVPVALAFGEWKRASGKDLLAAMTLGIEVSCRVSLALNPRDLYERGFHPTSVSCGLGAAATAGSYLELDRSQWLNCLGLAGNQASGLLSWASDPTEDSRPFNPGIAARNGATAALLASLGFGGPPAIFDGKYDLFSAFSAGGQRPDQLSRTEWAVTELAFKLYSSCAFTHPGLDALLGLMAENQLGTQDIERIELRYPKSGAHMIDNNELRSHCAQYVLAVGAATGGVAIDDILSDRSEELEIGRLIRCTCVVADDELDKAYPERYESVVVLTRASGGKLTRRSSWARGTPQNPLTDEEVHDKFRRLAAYRISEEGVSRIQAWVGNAENQPNSAELARLLQTLD